MTSKIKKNYYYNLIYQILTITLPLITTPYVSRVLGSDGVGIFSFTNSVNSYFILFGVLGTAMYGAREIAYCQGDAKERSMVFWQLNIVRWIATSISMFVYYFTCICSNDYSLYYLIFTIQIFASALDISWYFQGMEKFKSITIRNLIIKIISTASIFVFVKNPDDLWLYILIYCCGNALSNILLWALIPNTIEKAKITKNGVVRHIRPIFLMFLPQAMTELYSTLDKAMLGVLSDDISEVGIYEQSQKLEKFSLSVVTALAPVMASRMASLYSENKIREMREKLKKSFHFMWLLSLPIACGIFAISPNLVPWFLGGSFLRAIPVMQVGVVLIVAIAISTTIGRQYLIPTRKQKSFTISVMVGMFTNLILNALLIPRYKAMGAIVASVLAECSVAGVQMFFIKKILRIRDIFSTSIKCIIGGLVMLLIVFMAGQYLPQNLLGTVVQVFIGITSYSLILLLLRDKMAVEILTGVVNKIKNVVHRN